jgi:hypothetical protein
MNAHSQIKPSLTCLPRTVSSSVLLIQNPPPSRDRGRDYYFTSTYLKALTLFTELNELFNIVHGKGIIRTKVLQGIYLIPTLIIMFRIVTRCDIFFTKFLCNNLFLVFVVVYELEHYASLLVRFLFQLLKHNDQHLPC